MAFFPGSTGGIYRQFSVTLAVSIFFSALLALTLTPALCATLLKPHPLGGHQDAPARPGWRGWPQRFFGWFNRMFARSTDKYVSGVGAMLSRPLRWLAVFVAIFGVTILLFGRLPGGFLPDEDQGYFVISYDAPAGSTMQHTSAAVAATEKAFHQLPQAQTIFSVVGFNFSGQGQSAALSWGMLKPYAERHGAQGSAASTIGAIFGAAGDIPGASLFAVNPPAIDSLGNATGFTMKVEDRSGNDPAGLQAAMGQILGEAAQNPKLMAVRPEGQGTSPQLYVDIDRVQARALGLSIADVNATLSIAFGSAYANDFSNQGSVQRVYLQADASQRMTPEDVLKLRVRSRNGQMAPFSAFTRVTWTNGPTQLQRYNGYPALTIAGQAAPGQSSGTALKEMEAIADRVLKSHQAYEWTGTAFEEKQAGGQIGLLLGLSLVVVFLLLVALYNSWAIPFSVLLVVPFGVLGAVIFTMLRGLSADVYFNIGLITIIGLAAKNAILVVEFAIDDEVGDRTPLQATLEAARQRLRPILMTSLAFILGMVPLVIAGGAGAASRHAVGTGVMGGMIAATAFGIFFTPLFYFAARKWLARPRQDHGEDAVQTPPISGPDEKRGVPADA
jgi:multidrug efflux pump